jgi:hypothetical protein
MNQVNINPMINQLRGIIIEQREGTLNAPRTLDREDWPPDYGAVHAWRQNQLTRFASDRKVVAAAKRFYANKPVAFINHWLDTYDPRNAAVGDPVWLPMVLFRRQQNLIEFVNACVAGETSGLVEKSRDMGATWVCVGMSVHWFLFGGAVAIGWGSQTQDKVDRLGDPSGVFEKIRMALHHLPDYFKPAGLDASLNYMRCVNPKTGATIVGEVGDNIGRGGRTMVTFVDEAAYLLRPEKVEGALLETTRTRIDISSVSGPGTVFHRKRESGVDWEPGQSTVKARTNVFVMDWRDHPTKDQDWYDTRKEDLKQKGLGHVFAQEIDRNYLAAAEGIIINAEWVEAAIDADKKLGLDIETLGGQTIAALDVADGGADSNALAIRKGPVLKYLDEWGERDTTITARRAVTTCEPFAPLDLEYDAVGVGSGVKGETNRLVEDKVMPKGIRMQPWLASAKVNFPADFVHQGDRQSPRNRDFFQNLKAQAWWMLARRFELTWQAVNNILTGELDPDELIILPSKLPLIRKLQKELSQATASRKSTTLKLIVDKNPEGTKSPNLADSVVMSYWPVMLPERHLAIGGFSVLRQNGP